MPAVIEKTKRGRKTERMDLRVSCDTKEIIKRAAEIKGMNCTDFVASAAYDAAQATILGHEMMRLNREQSLRLARNLINPPEPTEALRSLVRGKSILDT